MSLSRLLPCSRVIFSGPILSSIRQLSTSTARSARFGGPGGTGSRFAEQFGLKGRTQTGPTLRERLLGPTTGKPFVYGTYALAGASVFGIGLLCYYGLGMSKGMSAMDRSAIWPEYVRSRLHHTYAYLAGSLALTAGAGMAAARSPAILSLMSGGGILAMVATMAVIIGTGMVVRSIPYEDMVMKHGAWAVHCAAMGAVLAPLIFLGGPVMMRAAWYTAGIVGGLSATAMCAPSEKFLMMGGPLAMGLGVVFVANIGTFFLPPGSALGAGLASIVVYGGLILFSAFLLYDTQRLVKKAEMTPNSGYQTFYNEYGQPMQVASPRFDPINAQLSIYMDILNIFIRMVMILGGGNQRRK
jgi:FtsH-binding integral membrane protein